MKAVLDDEATKRGERARTGLLARTKFHLTVTLGCMIGCCVGVGATIGLITHDELSFVPTLCMIGIGVNIAVNLFTYSRYGAARRLVAKLESQESQGDGQVV